MYSLLKLNRHFKKLVSVSSAYCSTRPQHTQLKPKQRQQGLGTEVIPVFRKAAEYYEKKALRDVHGRYTYGNLFISAKELCAEIIKTLRGNQSRQILYLCPNDANYVITQWAIWMAGHTAVPVSHQHPDSLIEYYAKDSDAQLLITTPKYAELLHKVAKTCNKPLHVLDSDHLQNAQKNKVTKASDLEAGLSADFYVKQNAMILYTSGTTGNPKGVVLTHKNLCSQISTLLDAWKWTANDVILHVLPLHHVHGIVNALLCPLYVGAKCYMLPKYDSTEVWSALLGINTLPDDRKITVFMAVPTIYAKLIEEYEKVLSKDVKMMEYIEASLKNKIRLMVSGSAPLPGPVYEKWLNITGHRLLERYGMTEIGMCLSQEYYSNREPGYIGVPLPGVSVRLGQKDDSSGNITTLVEATNVFREVRIKLNSGINFTEDPLGELLVKGDTVFKEYYNKPDITEKEFTTDKWFKTGDVCQYSLKKKLFKILGRSSVDIIKSGGYKISAVHLETVLLGHPDITDCAIVGLPDEKWGEIVAAVVAVKNNTKLTIDLLCSWAKNYIPDYSTPKVLAIVECIPKNAMGKVNKKELIENVFIKQKTDN